MSDVAWLRCSAPPPRCGGRWPAARQPVPGTAAWRRGYAPACCGRSRTRSAGPPPAPAPPATPRAGLAADGAQATESGGQVAAPPSGIPDLVWEAAKTATRLRVGLAEAGGAPPELAEAPAALQYLACVLGSAERQGSRLAELWDLQNGLPAVIQTARNGPYLVTNVPRLLSHLGEQTRPTPQMRLCRCAASPP